MLLLVGCIGSSGVPASLGWRRVCCLPASRRLRLSPARPRPLQRGLYRYAQDTQRVHVPCRCIAPRTRTMATGIAPLPALLRPGIRARRRYRPLGAVQKQAFSLSNAPLHIFPGNSCVNRVKNIELFLFSWYNLPKSTERSWHDGFYTYKPHHPD